MNDRQPNRHDTDFHASNLIDLFVRHALPATAATAAVACLAMGPAGAAVAAPLALAAYFGWRVSND